ncbi:MAG TPA: hypothetical protein VE980_06090, partial [Pyrinomonadaceae bacterium]|nr:hypothetical protein [Pyrinomonadaceae bacterium]
MKKVLPRVHVQAILVFLILFCSNLAAAQIPRPSPTPPPGPIDGTIRQDTAPLTIFEEELRAKRAIKIAEKEHEENLARAKEIAEIGKELKDSLKDKTVLDHDSVKKVERLEKLTKK